MVFQCTFCYHAPKVLVFRKFAVSHSFNVVTRNFRFTSKKKRLTLHGVEDERLGGDHHRKSWNSKSSTSDPIGFCEAQCKPMWSLDQASTLFDLKTIRKLFREVMDLFFNDWIFLYHFVTLSPCSMQLRHVHAWHGYVDLWPPCERWLKGSTGDACDLWILSGFHRCTMPKTMLHIKDVAEWSILCFDQDGDGDRWFFSAVLEDLQGCIQGNLCRCTGYRPIHDARALGGARTKGCGTVSEATAEAMRETLKVSCDVKAEQPDSNLMWNNIWLVVWNILEHFSFFHILGRILPIDFHIFQRGWNHQPDMVIYGKMIKLCEYLRMRYKITFDCWITMNH